MLLGTDFRFRDDLGKNFDTIPIEILVEPFLGTVFRVKHVSVSENEDSGMATMKFDYDLIEHPRYRESILREDQKFNEFIGLVINTLILDLASTEVADTTTVTVEEQDVTASGEDYTTEFDSRSRVRS